MSLPYLTCSRRIRRTPVSARVEAAGVQAYTTYNHMLLPTFFRSPEEDYAHLKSAVQIWDVSCERQAEIAGPDARRLVQMTTPRDLSRMKDDQGYYIPMVDSRGGMLNDPVVLKLETDRYWVSLADSDMLYYFMGLATGFALDVAVFEPDVSPIGIQGPKSDELVRRVFGQNIVDTRFFRHQTVDLFGKQMVIARSGWSRQGGFEIYLDGSEHGEALWDLLFEAGEDLDVRAGCPNGIERIEGGLLSYGNDMTMENSPFEAGLAKFCSNNPVTGCLGHAALAQRPETRQLRPVEIAGSALPGITHEWPVEDRGGKSAGYVTSNAWSPDFQRNVGIAMIDEDNWDSGTELVAQTPVGHREMHVRDNFWI